MSDQRFLATENVIGANHPTLSDTINRLALVEHNNDGTHKQTALGSSINTATAKTAPVDADLVGLADSAASFTLKKLTWANLKAGIKSYYDSVSATLTNKTVNLTGNTLVGTVAQFNTAISDADFITAATGVTPVSNPPANATATIAVTINGATYNLFYTDNPGGGGGGGG